MEDGRKMEDGRWKMEDGWSRLEAGRFDVNKCAYRF